VTVSADLFNVANDNTVLQVFEQLQRDNTGQIKEIQSPRVWRSGARVNF
jgi:hypothetical protein